MTGPAEVPVLETERLVLRAHRPEDFEAHAALWADATVTRFIGGRPLTREEAWARFLRTAGHWRLLGFGFWAIEAKASGRLVGEAGFHEMRRSIAPAFEGTPEAGWLLDPAVGGQGHASEIARAIHEWSDANLAARAGYRAEAETSYHGAPTLLMRRPRRR